MYDFVKKNITSCSPQFTAFRSQLCELIGEIREKNNFKSDPSLRLSSAKTTALIIILPRILSRNMFTKGHMTCHTKNTSEQKSKFKNEKNAAEVIKTQLYNFAK